ncbi:hypothetical protein [Laceyella putida]|uniref:Uncharacterized protein n=1 Tax=Laceyella putida TaxID=110101 RepID=A0ABW2RQP4_9BACL
MRKQRKYTGVAFMDRGVLKFKIMKDGIWYGTLTIRGHIDWQEMMNAHHGCSRVSVGK